MQSAAPSVQASSSNKGGVNGDFSVYVGNLDPDTSLPDMEELIYELFLQAGPLSKVWIPFDSKTGNHKGHGFVQFQHKESVSYALKLMAGLRLCGRVLNLQPVTSPLPPPTTAASTTVNAASTSEGQGNPFASALQSHVAQKEAEMIAANPFLNSLSAYQGAKQISTELPSRSTALPAALPTPPPGLPPPPPVLPPIFPPSSLTLPTLPLPPTLPTAFFFPPPFLSQPTRSVLPSLTAIPPSLPLFLPPPPPASLFSISLPTPPPPLPPTLLPPPPPTLLPPPPFSSSAMQLPAVPKSSSLCLPTPPFIPLFVSAPSPRGEPNSELQRHLLPSMEQPMSDHANQSGSSTPLPVDPKSLFAVNGHAIHSSLHPADDSCPPPLQMPLSGPSPCSPGAPLGDESCIPVCSQGTSYRQENDYYSGPSPHPPDEPYSTDGPLSYTDGDQFNHSGTHHYHTEEKYGITNSPLPHPHEAPPRREYYNGDDHFSHSRTYCTEDKYSSGDGPRSHLTNLPYQNNDSHNDDERFTRDDLTLSLDVAFGNGPSPHPPDVPFNDRNMPSRLPPMGPQHDRLHRLRLQANDQPAWTPGEVRQKIQQYHLNELEATIGRLKQDLVMMDRTPGQ